MCLCVCMCDSVGLCAGFVGFPQGLCLWCVCVFRKCVCCVCVCICWCLCSVCLLLPCVSGSLLLAGTHTQLFVEMFPFFLKNGGLFFVFGPLKKVLSTPVCGLNNIHPHTKLRHITQYASHKTPNTMHHTRQTYKNTQHTRHTTHMRNGQHTHNNTQQSTPNTLPTTHNTNKHKPQKTATQHHYITISQQENHTTTQILNH